MSLTAVKSPKVLTRWLTEIMFCSPEIKLY
jgi:hypothetical protein